MTQTDKYSYTFNRVHLRPDEQIGLHRQATWELSYVITGAGTRSIGNTTENFSGGEVILIPPKIPHCWHFNSNTTDREGKIENITLTFENTFLDRCSVSFPELGEHIDRLKKIPDAVRFTKEKSGIIIAILQEMCNQSNAERVASFIRLMIILTDNHETRIVGRHKETDKKKKRFNQIHTYVVCNSKRDITLDDIARHVGMNRTSFCIFFKKNTGKTFVTYLNEYRIEIACQLLKQKKMAISEICYYVGFNNIPYFNRTFKRCKGVPPVKYQQQQTKA